MSGFATIVSLTHANTITSSHDIHSSPSITSHVRIFCQVKVDPIQMDSSDSLMRLFWNSIYFSYVSIPEKFFQPPPSSTKSFNFLIITWDSRTKVEFRRLEFFGNQSRSPTDHSWIAQRRNDSRHHLSLQRWNMWESLPSQASRFWQLSISNNDEQNSKTELRWKCHQNFGNASINIWKSLSDNLWNCWAAYFSRYVIWGVIHSTDHSDQKWSPIFSSMGISSSSNCLTRKICSMDFVLCSWLKDTKCLKNIWAPMCLSTRKRLLYNSSGDEFSIIDQTFCIIPRRDGIIACNFTGSGLHVAIQ